MKKPDNISKALDDLTKEHFYAFVLRSFNTINPDIAFVDNWHIELLCDAMEAVRNGKIKRLIINVPPRSLKSVIISVAFPAWVLANKPSERVVVASYTQALALKHSADTRLIMQSKWYRKLFPNSCIIKGENTKRKFCTSKNGYRFATSISGTLTGEGGNILIADDPHNPSRIASKGERKKVIEWFTNVFASRLNNKKTGAIILVMQRLHEEDLSGYLLSNSDTWHHISIPAISESDHSVEFLGKVYANRKSGDVLEQERDGIEYVNSVKADLGFNAFEAQYQQKPVSCSGNIIKKEWLQYIDNSTELWRNKKHYISIDCANSIGTENDFSVIATFCDDYGKLYLLDVIRVKMEYPKLRDKIKTVINAINPAYVLIEDKANGTSLIQDLQREIYSIVAIKPTKSKECRVNDIISFLECGNLIIAENLSWKREFEDEMLAFPHGKHDDQVDALSQMVNWYVTNIRNKHKEVTIVPRVRSL